MGEDDMRPFDNIEQWSNWTQANCHRCRKAMKCPLEKALTNVAFGDDLSPEMEAKLRKPEGGVVRVVLPDPVKGGRLRSGSTEVEAWQCGEFEITEMEGLFHDIEEGDGTDKINPHLASKSHPSGDIGIRMSFGLCSGFSTVMSVMEGHPAVAALEKIVMESEHAAQKVYERAMALISRPINEEYANSHDHSVCVYIWALRNRVVVGGREMARPILAQNLAEYALKHGRNMHWAWGMAQQMFKDEGK